MVEPFDILPPIDFGQHDAAGPRGHDRGKIQQGIRPVERIDPDPEPIVARRAAGEKVVDEPARERLVFGRDGIFQIEQGNVGGAVGSLGHFLFAVAGREQPGAHLDREGGRGRWDGRGHDLLSGQ